MHQKRPSREELNAARARRRAARPITHYDLSPVSLALIERVHAIDWLSRVGDPVGDTDVMSVDSAAVAREIALSDETANVWIASRNDMTGWLHHHQKARYNHTWNEIVDATAQRVQATMHRALKIARDRLSIGNLDDSENSLSIVLQGPIFGSVQEIEYADAIPRDFSRRVLAWYERGHFVCGFTGRWPNVRLLVY